MEPAVIAARLAALERSHRRLKRCLVALALVALGGLVAGAGDDGALTGRTLKLLDEQGRLRVLLTPASGLSFLGADGRARAILGLDAGDSPGLVLYGDTSRAILNVNPDGPALAMTGARGVLRAVLALVKGEPGLVFLDGEERERVHLGVAGGNGRGVLRAADGGTTWRVPAGD